MYSLWPKGEKNSVLRINYANEVDLHASVLHSCKSPFNIKIFYFKDLYCLIKTVMVESKKRTLTCIF